MVDRLIQQAICQVLTPIFDPTFSESSFGFRPKRSAHGAAKQVQQIIRQGHTHCIDVDLAQFFDRVQHDVLMNCVGRKVHNRHLLRLIGRYLRAGVMVEGVLQPTEEGAPQGGPLSPLLSNWSNKDCFRESNSGASLLHFGEPPSADPHARWCGGWAGKPARLPDLFGVMFDDEV